MARSNPTSTYVPVRSTRRAFLGATAALGVLPAFLRAQESRGDGPKRLLVLGGTVFLGPAIVEAALADGWEVTLYNRGKSAPDRFPDLELRRGDRNENDYASLADGTWDLVIDTSGYIPAHVTQAIEALGGADGGRIGHFVFVSTCSVYADPTEEDRAKSEGPPVLDEESPTRSLDAEALARYKRIQDVDGAGYGALKAHCEEAAHAALPGAVTVIRPGLIVGPEDRSDRYTYWPVRMAEGGDVLAPGDPKADVQFVDVRDLGPFCFDAGAARVGGVYNAVGFEGHVSMADVLESCRTEEVDARLHWASDAFLQEHGVDPWMGLPLWIPTEGISHYDNTRAREAGLAFRPLIETARDTLAWAKENRGEDHRWRAGITREKESEVLEALREAKGG